jgi:hypothetical protein
LKLMSGRASCACVISRASSSLISCRVDPHGSTTT